MTMDKQKQLLIASILLDIGMADDLISAVTSLDEQDFHHLKK